MDNLFDWEQPDDKKLNYIQEYGKYELKQEKKSILYSSIALLIALEFHPIIVSSALLANLHINELSVKKELLISILFIFIIVLCVTSYYFFSVRKKKCVYSNIMNNNIKTFATVVLEKKKKKILVQLPNNNKKSFKIPSKLYKKIKTGTPMIAINYDQSHGFHDKYDFIINPEIIAEDE